MTSYTCQEIATIWVDNGGSRSAVIDAVAVSSAESGRNNTAISSSGDYGLWQINAIHFGTVGINANNWIDPNVNARAAIAISQNGSNWAAWCTCWTDPKDNCGHGYLPQPQSGSPAGNEVAGVAAALGVSAGGTIGRPVAGVGGIESAWSTMDAFLGPWGKVQWDGLQSGLSAIERMF